MPSNIDKPSSTDFYKGITESIPDDSEVFKKLAKGYVAGYIAGKLVKNAIKKR